MGTLFFPTRGCPKWLRRKLGRRAGPSAAPQMAACTVARAQSGSLLETGREGLGLTSAGTVSSSPRLLREAQPGVCLRDTMPHWGNREGKAQMTQLIGTSLKRSCSASSKLCRDLFFSSSRRSGSTGETSEWDSSWGPWFSGPSSRPGCADLQPGRPASSAQPSCWSAPFWSGTAAPAEISPSAPVHPPAKLARREEASFSLPEAPPQAPQGLAPPPPPPYLVSQK